MKQKAQERRKKVFISYCSDDAEWVKVFRRFLVPLEAQGYARIWIDTDMEAGDEWRRRIDEALKTADLAVLLISQHYLNSRFIMEQEVERFVEREKEGSLRIYRILLSPCTWQSFDWINERQWRPEARKTLQEIKDAEGDSAVERALVEIAHEIQDILASLSFTAPLIKKTEPVPPAVPSAAGRIAVDLRIDHFDRHRYRIEVTFSQSKKDTENFRDSFYFRLNVSTLERLRENPSSYMQKLHRSLFANQGLRERLQQVREFAGTEGTWLCIRLAVDPNARELHRVIWEQLCRGTPESNPLLTKDCKSPVLNRFVAGYGERWADVRWRPKSLLSLYFATGASGPGSVSGAGPILDVEEYKSVAEAISDEPGKPIAPLRGIERLTSPTTPVSLRKDLEHRTEDSLLYLVCHASESDEEPTLLLHEAGGIAPSAVTVEDLQTELAKLLLTPRLLFLVPPQSGENIVGNALYARAASVLSEAGIAGVLTLQGTMASSSWLHFVRSFLLQLEREENEERMDLAMHEARAILNTDEALSPVLFCRLQTARLWYRPRFLLTDDDPNVIWEHIVDSMLDKKFTPIIGPAISQALSRSRREISQMLAEEHLYPMALHGRQSLPQVAQYIAIDKSRLYPRQQYREQIMDYVLKRYGEQITQKERSRYWPGDEEDEKLGRLVKEKRTAEMIEVLGDRMMEKDDKESHLLLAKLDLPLYISANWNRLMSVALKHTTGKPPIEYLFDLDEDESNLNTKEISTEETSGKEVLYVYGLFGRDNRLVFTEDDYLDFLLGFSRLKSLGSVGGSVAGEAVPRQVLNALANSSLLFLGFRMQDWDFRVLFRIISSLEGGRKRDKLTHVAVQVDPDDDYVMDPERTRRYLNKYVRTFGKRTVLYLGSAEDFLRELADRMSL